MTDMFTAGDLAIEVATRAGGIEYHEYEPANQPGYPCTPPSVLGRHADELPALLRAVDDLRDDHHFVISRTPERERVVNRKDTPARFRVTITPA